MRVSAWSSCRTMMWSTMVYYFIISSFNCEFMLVERSTLLQGYPSSLAYCWSVKAAAPAAAVRCFVLASWGVLRCYGPLPRCLYRRCVGLRVKRPSSSWRRFSPCGCQGVRELLIGRRHPLQSLLHLNCCHLCVAHTLMCARKLQLQHTNRCRTTVQTVLGTAPSTSELPAAF